MVIEKKKTKGSQIGLGLNPNLLTLLKDCIISSIKKYVNNNNRELFIWAIANDCLYKILLTKFND